MSTYQTFVEKYPSGYSVRVKFGKENRLINTSSETAESKEKSIAFAKRLAEKNKGSYEVRRTLKEVKRFEFSFDYNTDEDDVRYIQNLLDKAGSKAVARAGLDMEEMEVIATDAQELVKAKKAIQVDGFQIN
jgi:hypothetical protein